MGRSADSRVLLRLGSAKKGSLRARSTESWGMPSLTRRRSDNPHQVTWHTYYDDVHVGTIGERAGVPVDVNQWQWSCGFHPGFHPGQHRYGMAATFEEARAGFETDWNSLLPEIPDGAFDEWRHQRDWATQKYAEWDRGEYPRRVASSMMRCVCGVQFDSWKPAESYDHRGHIYAAQQQGIHW